MSNGLGRSVSIAALVAVISCSGEDTGRPPGGTTISGQVYWSGPLRGATVRAHQLVDGQRTIELGSTSTDEQGNYSLALGFSYQHVEVDVSGGSYTEATGGDVVVDDTATLHGVVLDLEPNERREQVVVTPWTSLVWSLGRARLAAGKESTYDAAVKAARTHLTEHLEFDPLRTPIAAVSAEHASPTESVRHGLSLAALSELARLAAVDQNVSVQSINTVELTRALVRDAESTEALLDGNGAESLYVGATCPPPSGCSAEGPGCYAACAIHSNTLRSRLASAVLSFLRDDTYNRTGLDRTDVSWWVEALRANVAPELFGPEAPEPLDTVGPEVTWIAPVPGATFAGESDIDVTADDPLGIAELVVMAEGAGTISFGADTDPRPERYAARFDTRAFPEGPLRLIALATDTEGNQHEAAIEVTVNNLDGGTFSGVVYKGRVAGATVRAFEFTEGVKGPVLGTAITSGDGAFVNLRIAEGYDGPVLLEAGGGGSYREEAADVVVALDLSDTMRTIVPEYVDGNGVSSVVITPLTSFATTYFDYLQRVGQGGGDALARWTSARDAVETHFGVANITGLTPLSAAEMTTLNAAARYGLVLIGLSELARRVSTNGGGDAGTFGPAMSSMRLSRALDLDLRDGCFDGRQGGTPLQFGTHEVGPQATRFDLANAIASYLGDGSRNQTPFGGAVDILPLLDTLATGGGNTAVGSCPTGSMHPDDGASFDQVAPAIAISTDPPLADPPHVRGTFTFMATATDALDQHPILRLVSPAALVDRDGDPGDGDATASIDSEAMFGGEATVSVVVEAEDHSGNRRAVTTTYEVDNRAPTISVAGVEDASWSSSPATITYRADDRHLAEVIATLDNAAFFSGGSAHTEGAHTLSVMARDRAGNRTTRTLGFVIDRSPPTLSVSGATPAGSVVRGTLQLTVAGDDALKALGSLPDPIGVTVVGPGGSIPASTVHGTTADGRKTVTVTVDTSGADDAAGGGALTMRFDLRDRAGQTAQLLVTRTMDNAPPALGWDSTGFVDTGVNGWWTGSPAPVLRGTTQDANLAEVKASIGDRDVATAAVTGGSWQMTLPAGTIPGVAPVRVTVTARDQAGNTTGVTHDLRYDATPPTVGFVDVEIRDESRDRVQFSEATSTAYSGPSLDPTHTHVVANSTRLGPATACTVSAAPTVTKYAYLLDELPPHVVEADGTGPGGRNPLRWSIAPGDTGIGVAKVEYRVTNATTGSTLFDWRELSGTNEIPLYRNGFSAPSIPLLGTTQGLLKLEVRATDHLQRVTSVERCWNHLLLAAPIALRTLDRAVAATNGPIGSNKWGLSLLRLDDSDSPYDPVSMMLAPIATGTPAGAGLFEFPVYNPTSETVYLSVDLDLPTASTWSKSYYENKWVYRDIATNTDCGYVEGGKDPLGRPQWIPDESLPGCARPQRHSGDRTLKTANGTLLSSDFGVRIWRVIPTSGALTELVPCQDCSTTPAASGRLRVTVELPPRGVGDSPPLKFVIMPVLRPTGAFTPNGVGPFSDFLAGGTALTGQIQDRDEGCQTYSSSLPFRCTARRELRQVRYLKSVTVANVLVRTAFVFTSWNKDSTTRQPPHLSDLDNRRLFSSDGTPWNTTEVDPPSL